MKSSKTLILVRHAKSSWDDQSLSDHNRPLNARGTRDAPLMAARLASRGAEPQRIISSSAVRALDTARVFADCLELEPDELIIEGQVYGAGYEEMVELIQGTEERLDRVMLVGHNPTFSELAHRLTGGAVGHLPTCSVVTMVAQSRRWRNIREGVLELVDFDFPKRDRGSP